MPSYVTGDGADAKTGGSAPAAEAPLFDKGAYFIGKAVWGKGYSELLERLAEQKAVLDGVAMPIDIYGTGEDLDEACLLP
jgi:digalactosyldiacylglycerol synthase